MANTLAVASYIAKTGLIDVENNLVLGKLVHRQYRNEFSFPLNAHKGGNQITIKKPIRFRAQSGAQRVPQDISEQTTTITIDKHYHVSWDWSVVEKTLSIGEFREQYLKPAMSALANQIDYELAGLYIDIAQSTGTAGTTPAAWTAIGDARQKLSEAACPSEDVSTVLNPAAFYSMANVLGGKYSTDMVEESLRKVALGKVANTIVYESQNIRTHTIGTTWAGTVVVDGASQTGSTLHIDGFTGDGTLKKGDVFTISASSAVKAVNPKTGQSTGANRQFVLTADTTTSGNEGDFSIAPSIITSGAYQTVNAGPSDNATITVPTANEVANLMFHKNAFAVVTVPLQVPDSAPFKAQESANGISITVTKAFDIDGFSEAIRLDVLFGVKTLDRNLACRIRG